MPSRRLAQQFSAPVANIATKYLIPIFRYPNDMIFAVPDRMAATFPEFVGFVGLSGVFLFNFRPWLPGGQSSAPNGN